MTYPRRDTFRGQPVLQLGPWLAFGVAKARLIVESIDEIRRFVQENDEGPRGEPQSPPTEQA